MKIWKQIKLTRVNLLLLSAAILLVALAGAMTTRSSWTKLRTKAAFLLKAQTALMVQTAPMNATFTVRNYNGKCLEFGRSLKPVETVSTSYPVFISDCNGTAAQQVRVEELTDRPGHLVILRAGSRVIGKKLNTVPTQQLPFAAQEDTGSTEQVSSAALIVASAPDQIPLEAQHYTGSPGQIFALDGDSIILAEDRNLVVEVQNNRGKNQTPLVLGRRDLADAEFWTFTAINGSNLRPTSGFVRVPADGDQRSLAHQLVNALQTPQPGTVIEIEEDIDLTDQPPLFLFAGVTLRGDRRGAQLGPELRTNTSNITLLEIAGHDVRITGLRLKGPSRDTDGDTPGARGILASDEFLRSNIDHNDISDWPTHAVDVYGDRSQPAVCHDNRDPRGSRPQNVRVARNFIHHNRRQGDGYGVEAHYGGFPLIEGNTFVENRHAIMADGKACTTYLAYYNLALSAAPKQERAFGIFSWYTHDFDVHGTDDKGVGGGRGGQGGQYFEIAWNTFLGTNRHNFELRGEPSYAVDIGSNISLRRLEDAINCSYCGDVKKLRVYTNNQFNSPNPTTKLGVGDFDGDGNEDLFLATGAAWYYAPAGKAEWRFLNARGEKLDQLLFGDFDGDGRMDVFTQHGMNWDVSWGGASHWEKINQSTEPMSGYYIGDFDGDRRADVFYANGQEWFLSAGGVGIFTHFAFSTHTVANLQFGNFNRDGKTDVFGVSDDSWLVVYGGTNYWAPLRARLTSSSAGLIVKDFNGDGLDDIARTYLRTPIGHTLQVSFSGVGDWTTLRSGLGTIVAFGRFDSAIGADALFWAPDNYLNIASGGAGATQRHSRQDMR